MRSFLASMTSAAIGVVLVILVAAGVAAQSSTGNMRGTVKDAQGVIPGATVALVNDANGTTRETVSNESGEYSFPALEPGSYSVRVAVPGFRTFERKGVRINTQANVGLDIPLEVGSLEETITVTADAPLIETTNASTGGVVDQKTLESIPTAGRSVFLMATLEPTVQSTRRVCPRTSKRSRRTRSKAAPRRHRASKRHWPMSRSRCRPRGCSRAEI